MTSYMESGFEMNVPTIVINSRRHHAFISSRNICPPNIRHQLLKNICGGLRCAHGKGYRCGIDQDAQQYIPFCRFKQQLNVVPRKNQCQNQNDQRNAAVGTDAMMVSRTELKLAKSKEGSSEDSIHA